MDVMRFHSPYRHWVVGLLAEIGTFVGFMLVAGAVAFLASLVG